MEENIEKERHPEFVDWKDKYCQNVHIIQNDLQFQHKPYRED